MVKKKMEGRIKDLWEGKKWRNVVVVVCSLFIYTLLLPSVGFLIATFGLLTFLFGIMGRQRLRVLAVSALIATLLSYLVFYAWLEVQLPKGIFGF